MKQSVKDRLFESPTSNHGWIRFKARYPEDKDSIAIVRGAFHGRGIDW
jgi:hypothetical protein